jgi:hypothetical protein
VGHNVAAVRQQTLYGRSDVRASDCAIGPFCISLARQEWPLPLPRRSHGSKKREGFFYCVNRVHGYTTGRGMYAH